MTRKQKDKIIKIAKKEKSSLIEILSDIKLGMRTKNKKVRFYNIDDIADLISIYDCLIEENFSQAFSDIQSLDTMIREDFNNSIYNILYKHNE